jgi:hypothetical protein
VRFEEELLTFPVCHLGTNQLQHVHASSPMRGLENDIWVYAEFFSDASFRSCQRTKLKKSIGSDVTCASAFPQLMSSQLGSIRSLVSLFVSNRHETEMKDPGQLFSCRTGAEVGEDGVGRGRCRRESFTPSISKRRPWKRTFWGGQEKSAVFEPILSTKSSFVSDQRVLKIAGYNMYVAVFRLVGY